MTKESVETLKESLDRAIEIVTSRIWDLEDTLDKFKDRTEEARDALNNLPAEDLNELITLGFIPGAKVECRGVEFQFMGYTMNSRMEFKDANGNSNFTDISVCRKHLDIFTFLKDNEQEGTDK